MRRVTKEEWQHFRDALKQKEHQVLLRLTTAGHICYYTLVSWEAHGMYRYAAGAVGILIMLEICTARFHK